MGQAGSGPLTLPVPAGDSVAVRVLVDGSVLEVYAGADAGGGRAVATERVYPRADDTAELTVCAADGSGGAFRVTGWELVPPRRGRPPGTAAS